MTANDPGRKLEVLAVSPKGVLGGAERWLLSVIDNTNRINLRVVLLEDGPFRHALRERGVPVAVLPVGADASAIAMAALKLRKYLAQARPDVVWANSIKSAAAVLPAAVAGGYPVVWVKHDPTHEGALGRAVAKTAARIIVGSDTDHAHTWRTDCDVITPPMSFPAELDAMRVDRRLVAEGSDPVGAPQNRLAMVARLVPNKGIDTALEALAAAPGWSLVVAGGTDSEFADEAVRLTELAARLGVLDRFEWIGETDNPWSVLAGADAAAVLSRPGEPGLPRHEGFGMVTVEAAALGLPVLADGKFVPSVQALGGAGVLQIDATDHRTVSDALNALSDHALRVSLGQAGHQAALALPGPVATADAVVDVLADAARRPGAGRETTKAFSVATTVFNEGSGIDELITNLRRQIRVSDSNGGSSEFLDDEIVVVDGGSTDGSWQRLTELAAAHPEIRAIQQPGAGISAGRNRAISEARHEWIACTDAGCRPADGWLAAFRRGAASGNWDLLTGLYTVASPSGAPWQRAMVLAGYPVLWEARHPTAWARFYSSLFGLDSRAELPTGRCVAFTRKAWEAAGGYPEDLATAEDVLFGVHAVEAGARATLVTDAVVDWDQRPTLSATSRMYRSYGRGGGQSGATLLISRDLARAGAYLIGPLMLAKSGPTRGLALVGAGVYLSTPLYRGIVSGAPLPVLANIPLVMALKDISKALGCLQGIAERVAGPR